MAITTFYTHLTDLTGFACRLTQKVYSTGQNVLVWLPDEESVQQFDQALWSFNPISFIPHEIWLSGQDELADLPIVLLSCGSELPKISESSIIINLDDIFWCDAPQPPQRVLELVSADLDSLAAARQRFRTYRKAGYIIEHYDMRKKDGK
ncbi:MAG: DNA polymerase III subunit chi [Snodgrassella sp.]|nr:DNA polymerase III subunit chi [Snodgrassella sp.]